MDQTKLTNTLYTADRTRFSRLNAPSYHYPNHNHEPIRPDSRVTVHSHMSANPNPIQRNPVFEQTLVRTYCPVCHRDYSNEEAEAHARIHDSSFKYNFHIADSRDKVGHCSTDNSDFSNASVYPLVEPLEFYTSELSDSKREDNFYWEEKKNYDGVDRSFFKETSSIGIQTLTKPPLQYESNSTDTFNWLDNAFNSGKGPKFSAADVFGNNEIVTPKRELDEWETMRKEGHYVTSQR